MAWSWGRTILESDLECPARRLKVLGGKLWCAACTKLFYTTGDGTTWTADINLPSSFVAMEVHQGTLYAISTTFWTGQLYRRDGDTWTLLYQTDVVNDNVLFRNIASDGASLKIVGITDEYCVGWQTFQSVVWNWDGSSLTVDYLDPSEYEALFEGYPFAIGYLHGEWYAESREDDGGVTKSALRRRAGGAWPIAIGKIAAFDNRNVTYSPQHGVFWGSYLYDDNYNTWSSTWPAWPNTIQKVDHCGITIGASSGGYIYTYGAGKWTNQGPIGHAWPWSQYVGDIQDFGGNLYACGSDTRNSSRATVWRKTVSHLVPLSGWPKPTARQITCDHQYGDTLYLGCYKSTGLPIAIAVGADLDWWDKIFDPTTGSYIQTQTIERRDTVFVFGNFGTDDQIEYAEDGGYTWNDGDDDWGSERIATFEFHPTSGSDLVITRETNQDWMQTLTQRLPWTDEGTTPFVVRSQLRVGDDVWVGRDTSGSPIVEVYSGGSWLDKSNGLPSVPINDLELGF